MGDYKKALGISELQPGQATTVSIDGTEVALFNVDGKFYALTNVCGHRGGPLGEGDLSGEVVTCPWHGWEWNVTDGANVGNPTVRVKAYPAKVEGQDVMVLIE